MRQLKTFLRMRMKPLSPIPYDANLLQRYGIASGSGKNDWEEMTSAQQHYFIHMGERHSKAKRPDDVDALFFTPPSTSPSNSPPYDVGLMSVAYLSLLGDKRDKRFDEIAFMRGMIFAMCMSDTCLEEVRKYHLENLQRATPSPGIFKNPGDNRENIARLAAIMSLSHQFDAAKRGTLANPKTTISEQTEATWLQEILTIIQKQPPSAWN